MHVIQTAENPSPVESTSLCEYDMISPFPNSLVSLFLQSRNPMVMSNLDDTLEKVAHTALRSNNRNTKPPTRSCRTTTAKHHNRRFVVHNYHDHALDQTVCDEHVSDRYDFRGAFPMKLHDLLDYVEVEGLTDVVSWQPHGRSFAIRKPTEFVDNVMPK